MRVVDLSISQIKWMKQKKVYIDLSANKQDGKKILLIDYNSENSLNFYTIDEAI